MFANLFARVVQAEGVESLSPIERTVFRAYIFDTAESMGGLTSFFYNTDSSPEVSAETAAALESIGAFATADLFRTAASLICRPALQQGASTSVECLERVDPDDQLATFSEQMAETNESVFGLLEAFVIRHRNELSRKA